MKLELLPEDRHDEAVEFLTAIFPGSEGAPYLDRALRHWKYYTPHPLMSENRSYVFRDAKGLIAHGGFSPVEYDVPGGARSSFQIIDWAGSPRCPGAGFLLFRALWPKVDSYLAIGGSDDAKQINRSIPTLRAVAGMATYVHPVRPWGQLVASPWSWKSPLKWGRSWKWKLARKRIDLKAWKAAPVERLNAADAPLLAPATQGLYSPLRRTAELVNYWLDCPGARMRAWRLEYQGAAAGLLVLAFLPKEARIADLILNNATAPLAEAYSLAMDLAAADPDVCEVRAASSAPPAIEAMAAAGMIPRGIADVSVGDPRKNFPKDLPIEVNLTIGDAFYLRAARPYFFTFG